MSKAAQKAGSGHSRTFFDLIRAIGEAKSKQDEDRTIVKELALLKQTIGASNIQPRQMKELIIRVVYCEMLGHPAEFGYIHAVKLMPAASLLDKRVGYLVVSLCLKPEDELVMLAVAQIQKDLASSNYLEVCVALTACCKMLSAELIPCVIQAVQGLMNHSNALVRKKAIMAIHAFYKIDDTSIGVDLKQYRNCLCDKDPSVMGASLHLLYDIALNDPEEQKDLVPSFVNILKQLIEHRLSREYDYHRVPAPWMQIKLLKLLSLLCADDKELSEQCYDVILEAMKRSDSGLNIGHAVIYECVKSVTCIWPSSECIEAAADSISQFVTSTNPNLKYLGITSLSAIVRLDRSYAQEHQAIVMECLTDHDETIKRKTLDLLYGMTTEHNVEVIVNRLCKFLTQAHDNYLRADLVHRITELARKFRTDNQWYVNTLNFVIEKGAKHLSDEVVQGLLKLIAEGEGEDEDDDTDFRKYCVQQYFDMLGKEKTWPDMMYKIMAWVIGEYGFMMENITPKDQIDRLCDLMERQYEDTETKGWIITALMKLTSQRIAGDTFLQEQTTEVISKFWASRSTDLQQRAHEFKILMANQETFRQCLPLDGCCEDIEVDENLSFMNELVEDCIARGWKVYKKKDDAFASIETGPGLNFTKYEAPQEQRHETDLEEIAKEGTSVLEEETKLEIDSSKARWGLEEKKAEEAPEEEKEEEPEPDLPDVPLKKGKKKKKRGPTKKEIENQVLFGLMSVEEANALKASQAAKKGKKKKKAEGGLEGTPRVAEEVEAEAEEPTTSEAAPVETQAPPPPQEVAAAPAATEPAKAASPNVLDDLFGPSTTQKSSNNALDDLFGGGAPKAGMVLATGVTTQRTSLAADPYVKVDFQKVYVDNSLAVQFFLTAVGGRAQQVIAQFVPPAKFQINVECNAPGTAPHQQPNTITFPALDPSAPVTIQVTLSGISDFAIGNQLVGQIAYFNAMNQQQNLPLTAPILINDIIRPQGASTTQEFGTLWVAHVKEAKVAKKLSNPDIAATLYGILNVKAIQVIGSEVILVGKIIGKEALLLVHVMVGADQTANITIHSNDQVLTDSTRAHLEAYLQ
eukprot:TRINITY_DN65928_c7_g1_i1.p1 TRINITY_DN65928_c7_g1~~TRINITY_DN65928_c7_g1_i1.p1  ORF type:complete len:1086 (+),score=219.34 TRINITY_DN65928_c7_g1_i1:30-3287(+)